jgi:hypothetical protein
MESSRHTSFEYEVVVGFLQGGSSHLYHMVDLTERYKHTVLKVNVLSGKQTIYEWMISSL